MDISERNFEATIEAVLLRGVPPKDAGGAEFAGDPKARYAGQPGGYRKRPPEDYNRALCLVPGDVPDFIYATQPKEWEKFKKQHGTDAKERLLRRLATEIKTRGTLEGRRFSWIGCSSDT